MNTQMNTEQVASFIKLLEQRIEAFKEDWTDANAVSAVLWPMVRDQNIKATESALSDFMDVLNNG